MFGGEGMRIDETLLTKCARRFDLRRLTELLWVGRKRGSVVSGEVHVALGMSKYMRVQSNRCWDVVSTIKLAYNSFGMSSGQRGTGREEEGRGKKMYELLTKLYGGYTTHSNLIPGRLWNNHGFFVLSPSGGSSCCCCRLSKLQVILLPRDWRLQFLVHLPSFCLGE